MASLPSSNRTWIGWPGIASDDLTDKEHTEITKQMAKQGCIPIFLTTEQIQLFYEGYANDTLWPMFHYFQSYVQYNEEYWETYKQVNQMYADAVIKLNTSNSIIWVHDYQLLLTPGMMREVLPDAHIGFFLHIPFPSYEIFRQLPNRIEIIEGILGADLIGLHIYDYVRHFLSSVQHITGNKHTSGKLQHMGRTVTVDNFPIGINYKHYRSRVTSKTVKQESKSISDHYEGQKIVVSIDRLDYSKGILQRLEAFELYLSENPDKHKKISLVMVAVPSRTEVETYQILREEIELAISRINGTYAVLDWTPISYQFKNLPMDRVMAMLNAADVALVTPLRDGMNLVAKEFVVCQTEKPGVLILSEMAGASDELPEAITVNPNSIRGMAEALGDALTMDVDERDKRIEVMKMRIKNYDVQHWANDFTSQLQLVVQEDPDVLKSLDHRSTEMLRKGYKRSQRRLVMLDYDGTLKPLVDSPDPNDAKPSVRIINILRALAADDRTHVVIISGRSKEAIDDWFGTYDIALVAEHGAWVKKQDGEWTEQRTSFEDHREGIMNILNKYALRTPGSVVEQKSHSVVWHYRNVLSELAYNRNQNIMNDLERILEGTDISAHHGKKIIEIKPDSVDKGKVADAIYRDIKPDFTICIGDDFTDEDMFKALPEEAITIKVGEGPSSALLRLGQVRDVHSLLSELANS